jgi:hypothetical protein
VPYQVVSGHAETTDPQILQWAAAIGEGLDLLVVEIGGMQQVSASPVACVAGRSRPWKVTSSTTRWNG